MKKIIIVFITIVVLTFFLFSYERNIGNVYFPSFVHKGQVYKAGRYKVKVNEENGNYYFSLFKKGNLVLKELAVVKPVKYSFKGVKKQVLKGKEYFRISFYHNNNLVMGYFYLKK